MINVQSTTVHVSLYMFNRETIRMYLEIQWRILDELVRRLHYVTDKYRFGTEFADEHISEMTELMGLINRHREAMKEAETAFSNQFPPMPLPKDSEIERDDARDEREMRVVGKADSYTFNAHKF